MSDRSAQINSLTTMAYHVMNPTNPYLIQEKLQPINYILWFSIWLHLSLCSEALGLQSLGLLGIRLSPMFLTITSNFLGVMQNLEEKSIEPRKILKIFTCYTKSPYI